MAVTTNKAHVNIALYLKDKLNSTYLALGKSEEWVDDKKPPAPTKDKTQLDEVIGYKRADTVSLCRPLRDGETTSYNTIEYFGKRWALIPDELAHEETAYYVYYETRVYGGELPATEYRQVGIHTELKPKENNNSPILVPEEVEDVGTLEFYENRPPQTYSNNTNLIERFIINCNVT